ncbi:MAG: hypothetical protein RJB68_2519 [Pseudomonadota bacterium]|jgi:hypothetical protein
MTILPSNIRLLESERMTDTTDGGGRRTSRVIPDGIAGNIFPKVSRVDSVYGRVNLRKVYPHVNTTNLDVYAGAHFIISDAPDNNRISVLAFSTGSDFDQRTAARDRIESYVIAGPESRMVLYGRQLKGSQAILAYQREEESLPEVGEVYAISTEVGGATTAQQFVRLQDVVHEVRTFTDTGGEFRRRVVTLKIGSPLRYEFQGIASPSRFSGSSANTGVLRTTTVADAARYFGLQPLTSSVSSGALELTVTSVYAPIVPTTQRETPLSLVSIAGASALQPSSSQASKETIPWVVGNTPLARKTSLPIKAGSLRVRAKKVVSGLSDAFSEWVSDNGSGVIPAAPAATLRTQAGTVDYESGTITLAISSQYVDDTVFLEAEYVPAVEVAQPAHTKAIEITLGTRGTVYAVPLLPIPAPGTLIVDYRALGKWYRLRDNGLGELVGGDSQYGTGSIDYVTGGATITLGALPDVGSSVLLSWGSPVHYSVVTNDAGNSARFSMTLPDLPVKRASAVVTYYVGGVANTATAGIQGLIAGANSVTGSLNHVTGALSLEFGGKLPDAGSVISVAYAQLVPSTPGDQPTLTGSFPALTPSTLAGAPFDPGSLQVTATFRTVILEDEYVKTLQLVDDGLGNLVVKKDTSLLSYWAENSHTDFLVVADTVVGSVNYSTGAVALTSTNVVGSGSVWNWANGGGPRWLAQTSASCQIDPADDATYSVIGSAVATSDSARTATTSLDDSPLVIDLLRTTGRSIAEGSVRFELTGKSYLDRNGVIYTNIDPLTGSGLAVGSIDYTAGLVSLKVWNNNVASALSVKSCLTVYGQWTAVSAFFRTAGSPIRPASLYIQVTAEDGTLLSGSSDQNGNISGPYMRGFVEQSMGVVYAEFGELVTAAGNETEDWYDPDNVIGLQVWKPRPVQPRTLRYSTVVLSNLPLDADILGLDPVRLPSDGRVPIYRPADVVVVHHTDIYDAGTPAAGSVIHVGRTDLSVLWLEDAEKKKLSSSLYVVDLAAGTATMAADLSLAGYVTPIVAKHRIEEMGLLSDVQINGQVTLTAPLLRDFPAGSLLSSALLYGDLQARATNLFDQQTWTGVWQGSLIGSGATAQYNDVDYPVEVFNSGAITERWRLNFTSSTAFQIIGENSGVIGTGTTGVDLQPVNALTGLPYFTLRAAGWGLGWSAGNQLRFDTIAAAPPTWLVRTVLPGATLAGDSFDAQLRGDVD